MGFLFKKKTMSSSENRLGALRIQSSTKGLPIPLVYGTTRVSPDMVWYDDFTAIPHTTETTQGGKGGGVKQQNTTYTYTAGVLLAVCEGPFPGESFTTKVWADKKVVTPGALGLSQFVGTLAQAPWGYLTTNHPSQALAYAGTVFLAAAALDLGDQAGLPNMSFEVSGFYSTDMGVDANPGNIVADLVTSDLFGAAPGTPLNVDLTNFIDYCAAAGFKLSPAYVSQRPAVDMITELAMLCNSAPFWSGSVLKIMPFVSQPVVGATTYTPDMTPQYSLTYDDFIAGEGEAPVKVSRRRNADAFNSVQIECLDRSGDYNTAVIEAKDQTSIDLFGLRPMPMISAHAICDLTAGRAMAEQILQRTLNIRNQYSFKIGWRYARLEAMDLVAITDPLINGMTALLVRVIKVEEDDDGALAITAEDVHSQMPLPGTYASQGSTTYKPNFDVAPGAPNAPVIFQPPLELSGVPQVWVGGSGGVEWGSAEVWVSIDGTNYAKKGTLLGPARHGTLTADFPGSTNPDTTNTLAITLAVSRGELASAPSASADSGETLCYIGGSVGGEIIGYSTATLTGAYTYDLDTYIRRGAYSSIPSGALSGQTFVRLDTAIAKIDLPEQYAGQTISVKLLSFNRTGGGGGVFSSVYSYTVQPFGVIVYNNTVVSPIEVTQSVTVPSGASYTAPSRLVLRGRLQVIGRLTVAA